MRAVEGKEGGMRVNGLREGNVNPVAGTGAPRDGGGDGDVTGKKRNGETSQRDVLISLFD